MHDFYSHNRTKKKRKKKVPTITARKGDLVNYSKNRKENKKKNVE
jgi:hypothetical protein